MEWNEDTYPTSPSYKIFVQGELAMFCWKRRFGHVVWDRLVQVLKTTRYDPNNMYRIYSVRDMNDGNVNENAM
jgi:hypothetical protein